MNKTILLIPHYNNPQGLVRSLASIDASENIDVLIVDDGSRKQRIDQKAANNSFAANGEIHYIFFEENKGIEHALNAGLDFIQSSGKYKFVARLDSDDCCIGQRFRIQEEFLEQNSDIMLVGSNVIAVNSEGKFLYNIVMPQHSDTIRKKMFLNSMFMHPSVMLRTEVIDTVGQYPLNYKAAEDYAYFFKICKKYDTANIQEFLIRYEINPAGISISRRKEQVASRIRVIIDNFYFGFYPIYGLLRSLILYIVPQKVIAAIKNKRG